MPRELQQLAARLSARARKAAWMSECARWAAPALFVLGAAIFVARFFGDVPRAQAAAALGLFALVPVAAWLRVRAGFLSQAGAIAWLDRASGGRGARARRGLASRAPRPRARAGARRAPFRRRSAVGPEARGRAPAVDAPRGDDARGRQGAAGRAAGSRRARSGEGRGAGGAH